MTSQTPTSGPTLTREPNDGYRPHDHVADWQECDTCGLRLGRGIATEYDAAYYDSPTPGRCPRCADGLMCLTTLLEIVAEGGDKFGVWLNDRRLGSATYGTIDKDGAYIESDEEIIAYVRGQYDIQASVPAVVR